MTTNPKKRPIGLKAQQKLTNQNQSKKTRKTEQEEDSVFTTVALVGEKTESDENQADGLTFEDLIQLKAQAEELIDNPTGQEGEEDQLVNLLRGICHEAIRLIEVAEKKEHHPRLPHQFIAWASLELGFFLESNQKSERFVQPDEPKSFDAWLAIATQVLNKLPAQNSTQSLKEYPDLELLPHSISLLNARNTAELLTTLKIIFKQKNSNETECEDFNYLLRTIDRLILLKSDLIAEDPNPIFNILIELLKNIRSFGLDKKVENIQDFHQLIDQRLGDCYLTHGSLLVEQLENLYYPQDEEDDHDDHDHDDEQKDKEEDFKLDLESPTYKLALEALKLAEQTFLNLLDGMDDSHELKDLLKSKLEETLLTMGNLLPPGPKRESLYLRAGLNNDK